MLALSLIYLAKKRRQKKVKPVKWKNKQRKKQKKPNLCHLGTYSFVIIPLGPVGVASFGSKPWVPKMCRAAGLRRNLEKKTREWQNFSDVDLIW